MCKAFILISGFGLAVMLSGCGDSGPDSGTVPFKATQSPAIDAFSKQIAENAKAGKIGKPEQTAAKPGGPGSKTRAKGAK